MLSLLAQPKQPSTEQVVLTLCDRLANSPLLEDRRAAVLGLKSLAHDSRELVASAGLRALLAALSRDADDVQETRAVLETLLLLFNPGPRTKTRNRLFRSALLPTHAPQPASDIALWLTDAFLHSEEAFNALLELIHAIEPFVAFYALQLASAMVANRPVETKLRILAAGGTSAIVLALSSTHDMIRGEALLLLGALCADSLEMQKLVAFENGFERLFALLADVGGVVYGGTVAEDCLQLLSVLLDAAANQELFVQTGFVKKYVDLLTGVCAAEAAGAVFSEQATSNIEAVLSLAAQMCLPGADTTRHHQHALCSADGLLAVLRIAFGAGTPTAARVPALLAAGALVANNAPQQEQMLAVDVPYYDLNLPTPNPHTVPVAQALLKWSVELGQTPLFDLRAAACVCFANLVSGNSEVRQQLVAQALLQPGADSQALSLVSVLTEHDESRLNPFRRFFAAADLLALIDDSTKKLLNTARLGDQSLGLEPVSFLPAVGCELQGLLSTPGAPRTPMLGLLQLLVCYSFDDPESVDALLTEASVVQALLAHTSADPLVQSLCAVLLGTIYLFCNLDAPLPRRELHNLLLKSMGRDQYKLYIKKLRLNSDFARYDESSMFGAPRGADGVPEVFFITQFVEIVHDNLGRIERAIDADPAAAPVAHVTVDMADELRLQLEAEKRAAIDLVTAKETIETQLVSSNRRTAELEAALKEAQDVTEGLKERLGAADAQLSERTEDLEATTAELGARTAEVQTLASTKESLSLQVDKLQAELVKLREAKQKAENGINKMNRELMTLTRQQEAMEKEKSKLLHENRTSQDKLTKQEAEIGSLKVSADTAIRERKRFSEMLEKANGELTVLKNKYDRRAGELQSETQRASALEVEVAELQHRVESLSTGQEKESQQLKKISELEADLQRKSAQVEETHSEMSRVKSQVDALTAKYDAAQADLLERDRAVVTLKAELAAKSEQADKEAAAALEKQGALDTLVLLLDDLTEKKSKYKLMAKEGGGSVSESDDDEE